MSDPLDAETLLAVVMKLTGPLHPVGEANVDEIRLKNLKVLTDLVDMLISEIYDIQTLYLGRPEASVDRAGRSARNFLIDLGSGLEGS